MTKSEERQQRLGELITQGYKPEVAVDTVAQEFGVQPTTVQKDLAAMSSQDDDNQGGQDPAVTPEVVNLTPPAPKAKLSVEEMTADNYEVPKGEEGFIHAKIEQLKYDESTGEKLSKARIQKYNTVEWPQIINTHWKLGWTIREILHFPQGAMAFNPKTFYKELKAKNAAPNSLGPVPLRKGFE